MAFSGISSSSEAPEYKNLMTWNNQRLGQSKLSSSGDQASLNKLWYQYGLGTNGQQYGQQQSSYSSRLGEAAGAGNGALGAAGGSQVLNYDYDYPDYGASNRRYGQYGGFYDYGSRSYGGAGSGLGVGYGGGGYSPVSVVSGYGPGVCEDKGLNPFLVLATLAGAGLAFFIIYRQITTGGKRNLDPTLNEFFNHATMLLWSGK